MGRVFFFFFFFFFFVIVCPSSYIPSVPRKAVHRHCGLSLYFLFCVCFNPFTPEFLKWTLPSLNVCISNIGVSDLSQKKKKKKKKKNETRMSNSVEPDEMAHDEPSHLDLDCLQRYMLWSAGLKGSST